MILHLHRLQLAHAYYKHRTISFSLINLQKGTTRNKEPSPNPDFRLPQTLFHQHYACLTTMARVRRNWTPEEDALLRRAVENGEDRCCVASVWVSAHFNSDRPHTAQSQSRPLLWRELAKSVPGRSNKDCRRRWWNSLADGTAKGPWSEEEDERLIAAVRKYGTNWRQVSREVGSRNADQCSSHWSQVLDPSINYCDWTPEEVREASEELLVL
jgi:hypothetical protein